MQMLTSRAVGKAAVVMKVREELRWAVVRSLVCSLASGVIWATASSIVSLRRRL